jgi:signal transduction histidine kinase
MNTKVADLWRPQVLTIVTWSAFGISSLAIVVGIVAAYGASLWDIILFDSVLFSLILCIALTPSRFFRFKATAVILVMYTVGFYFTYRFGTYASGPFWLFIVPALTAVFFGLKRAIWALFAIISTMIVFFFLLHQGTLLWETGQVDAPRWAVISTILVSLAGLLTISIGLLLANIERTYLERETALLSNREVEGQLRHSQKMEAIGRLASGISHDFNNLLTIIAGFSNFALEGVKDRPEVAEDLDEVIKATEKGQVLTAQLLSFSRKNPAAPQVIDINTSVLDTTPIIKNLLGDTFNFIFTASDEPCFSHIDPDALVQLLINLTINAKDAMDAGGKLHISTEHLRATEVSILSNETNKDHSSYILLSIKDTGAGISDESVEHIFEPFFTTKGKGKGSGLGLSTCWAIVQDANGFINVHSEVGLGTNIECYFPVSKEAAANSLSTPVVSESVEPAEVAEPEEVTEPDEVPEPANNAAKENILITEDEEKVLSVLSRAIGSAGYNVYIASNAEEALRVFNEAKVHIDLLVTDIMMPGLNGKELADSAVKINPNLKVIYISGYSDNALFKEGVIAPDIALLRKPFLPEKLIDEIRKILDH